MLKQSVNLKLGTSLKLTPQLKASLRLLQMSILDLEQEIRQQLETNVMLERNDLEHDPHSITQQLNSLPEDYSPENKTDSNSVNEGWDDIPTSELDTNYSHATPGPSSRSHTDRKLDIADVRPVRLFDFLAEQLNLEFIGSEQRLIYEYLIDALDDDGLLSESLDDIKHSLQNHLPDIRTSDIRSSLQKLQSCEPVGIAASNLSECLQLQLTRQQKRQARLAQKKNVNNAIPDEIFRIAHTISKHLDLLAQKKMAALRRECRTSVEKLDNALNLIRSLNPRPGAAFAQTENTHVIPDVVVKRHQEQWVLEINQQRLPKVRINQQYAQCLRGVKNDDLKQQLQQARFLINGLEMRQQTLVKLSQAIVAHQSGFLEHGETAMQPMLMRELAEELKVHESTISRVVANKYMQTPRGTYPLRFFFSSQITTDAGDTHSATAIKAEISLLIKNENKAKPLSDNKLAGLLKEKGIPVARRTVAKYREALGIPSTSERRQKQ